MFLPYFMLFLSLQSFSQTKAEVKVLPNAQTAEDFEHQNRGCPENSECDQVMGLQLKRWDEFIRGLKNNQKGSSLSKAQSIENYRSQTGIPVEFYTNKKSQQGFKPLYFNSPCKAHNPPKEGNRVLKGMAFVKGITKDKAIVWRDQAQIEIPTGDLLTPQPVMVLEGPNSGRYLLPLGDEPLFIKNKSLYILREHDEYYYVLKIALDGSWTIVDVDLTRLSEWQDKKDPVACPADKNKTAPEVFGAEFCKTVWDEDLKKTVVVKMHQGCST